MACQERLLHTVTGLSQQDIDWHYLKYAQEIRLHLENFVADSSLCSSGSCGGSISFAGHDNILRNRENAVHKKLRYAPYNIIHDLQKFNRIIIVFLDNFRSGSVHNICLLLLLSNRSTAK